MSVVIDLNEARERLRKGKASGTLFVPKYMITISGQNADALCEKLAKHSKENAPKHFTHWRPMLRVEDDVDKNWQSRWDVRWAEFWGEVPSGWYKIEGR